MKIGVLSDTHDFLDPKIPSLFKGVQHILHGGDIGMPVLLMELELTAPVAAVGGNTDDPMFRYADTRAVELGGLKFLLHHIVDPRAVRDDLKRRINRERPDVVIFGHTHKAFDETLDGVRYFNPGYAGKQRFNLKRSVAILHCEETGIRAEFLAL